MTRIRAVFFTAAVTFAVAWFLPVSAASALATLRFEIAGDDPALGRELVGSSLLRAARDENRTAPRQLVAAALADYGQLLRTLYENGRYGGVVSILLDGREAALIPLQSLPQGISAVVVRIYPGPAFRFGTARIAPLPPGARPPPAFAPGMPALSGSVRAAVEAAVKSWRAIGHAKAAPDGQSVVADHAAGTLSAEISIAPGPRVRFGKLRIASPSTVRSARIRAIAGLPEGAVFSPAQLDRVAARLHRTGAFATVALSEAPALGAGDSMDIVLTLADERPRRIGFGAEIASLEGLQLSGFWLHRNAFGGGERFRIEAEARGLGGGTGGNDYLLAARLDVPAVAGADTGGFVFADAAHLDETDYVAERIALGVGLLRHFSENLKGEIGVSFALSAADDGLGVRDFRMASLPASLSWDRRDEPLDPASGFYLAAGATPFLGFGGTASGVRATVDARAYRALGGDGGVVLAGRVQAGTLVGPGIRQAPPDFLFRSGGGGTVRGQPYQSLGIDLGGGARSGGNSFVALSLEARLPVTGRIGAVAFVDAAHVGANSVPASAGRWHSGAGLGVRYKTALGPIRLDLAVPVGGGTGAGVQFYLGIGQAF